MFCSERALPLSTQVMAVRILVGFRELWIFPKKVLVELITVLFSLVEPNSCVASTRITYDNF